jgi:ABC-type lipoprotein release transport system permease subunit
MNKAKVINFKLKDLTPDEHIEFILKKTTPLQRFKWLEEAWNFWHSLQLQRYKKRFRNAK